MAKARNPSALREELDLMKAVPEELATQRGNRVPWVVPGDDSVGEQQFASILNDTVVELVVLAVRHLGIEATD